MFSFLMQEAELEHLEKTVEPSWPRLVEPLEKIIDRLSVVWGMINHLKAVKDTPELRAAIEEVQVDYNRITKFFSLLISVLIQIIYFSENLLRIDAAIVCLLQTFFVDVETIYMESNPLYG